MIDHLSLTSLIDGTMQYTGARLSLQGTGTDQLKADGHSFAKEMTIGLSSERLP